MPINPMMVAQICAALAAPALLFLLVNLYFERTAGRFGVTKRFRQGIAGSTTVLLVLATATIAAFAYDHYLQTAITRPSLLTQVFSGIGSIAAIGSASGLVWTYRQQQALRPMDGGRYEVPAKMFITGLVASLTAPLVSYAFDFFTHPVAFFFAIDWPDLTPNRVLSLVCSLAFGTVTGVMVKNQHLAVTSPRKWYSMMGAAVITLIIPVGLFATRFFQG